MKLRVGHSMAWAFRLPPAQDELLSGYLSRVAFAHGAYPHAFYQLHLQDGWFWTRDIDRGATLRHHAALSQDAGLSTDALQAMTLRPWIGALTPTEYSPRIVPAVVPWINAAGIYQEGRRLHALQYCPECLATDGIVKRHWRLSFYTHCPRHNELLADACERCDAPFVPHRSLGNILRCSNCQSTLRPPRNKSIGDQAALYARQMQTELVNILYAATEGSSTAKADLHALRTLASALLSNPKRAKVVGDFLDIDSSPTDGWHRLELARIGQRKTMLGCLKALRDGWPETWRLIAQKLGLTRQTFSRLNLDAEWLRHEVEKLPPGWSRKYGEKEHPLERRVQELERNRPKNWRVKRATLFIRAVKRS
jgi:lambda repressor-like predicted transcriptional regulator